MLTESGSGCKTQVVIADLLKLTLQLFHLFAAVEVRQYSVNERCAEMDLRTNRGAIS